MWKKKHLVQRTYCKTNRWLKYQYPQMHIILILIYSKYCCAFVGTDIVFIWLMHRRWTTHSRWLFSLMHSLYRVCNMSAPWGKIIGLWHTATHVKISCWEYAPKIVWGLSVSCFSKMAHYTNVLERPDYSAD